MTILIAGGTGTLGTQIVRRLSADGLRVRIITRDEAHARHLKSANGEVVTGDLRDAGAVNGPSTELKR
jgi:uncharacterized protein YbjT (DUF2867 family)